MQRPDQELLESDSLRAALRNVFGPIDDALPAKLSHQLELVDVPGGSALFRQGDPGGMGILLYPFPARFEARDHLVELLRWARCGRTDGGCSEARR